MVRGVALKIYMFFMSLFLSSAVLSETQRSFRQTVYNVPEARLNRPDGGATAIKSTQWLITPKPCVA